MEWLNKLLIQKRIDAGPVTDLAAFSDQIQSHLLHSASSLRAHFSPDRLHYVRYANISSDLPGHFWSWIGAFPRRALRPKTLRSATNSRGSSKSSTPS